MRTVSGLSCAALGLFLCLPEANAASLCNATAGNLVANCGFETGTFTSWTIAGHDVPAELNNLYGVEAADPLDSIAPYSGSDQAFFADLDSNATTISQSIATIAGDLYSVSWYLVQDTAPGAGYSNKVEASFGGVSLVSQSGVGVQGYTHYSYTARAGSASSLMSMTFGNDLGEFLLDDVTVTLAPVPEPSAWTLVLCAAIFAFTRKRRISSACSQ